jgi:hypothetical protein
MFATIFGLANAALGAVGRMRGLRGVYPEYLHVHGRTQPDPAVLALAGIELPHRAT